MRLEELFICGRDTNVLLAIWSGKKYLFKAYRKPAMLHHGIYLVNGKNTLNPQLNTAVALCVLWKKFISNQSTTHRRWHYN